MPGARLLNDGSGASTAVAAGTDAGTTVLEHRNQDEINAALILWVRDEINAIRAVGVLGLGQRSVADVKTAVQGKLPT